MIERVDPSRARTEGAVPWERAAWLQSGLCALVFELREGRAGAAGAPGELRLAARRSGALDLDYERRVPLAPELALAAQPEVCAAVAEWLNFAGARLWLVARRAPLDLWLAALAPEVAAGALAERLLGLEEFAALWRPSAGLPPEAERSPEALLSALAQIVRELHALDPLALGAVARALERAMTRAAAEERAGYEWLAAAAALVDRPSRWGSSLAAHERAWLTDERLTRALAQVPELEPALENLQPLWAPRAEDPQFPPLPPDPELPQPLSAEDLARVERIFLDELPVLFAREGEQPKHRPQQLALAMRVAQGLGHGELLLAHAPTGTGKTLAYLVPALLFALRNSMRMGVATYTRALQEQAMRLDVPLALEGLARSGLADLPRVALLKGRQNYLCWRSFKSHAPGAHESAAVWLAYLRVLLFAFSDAEGDIDGLAGLELPPGRLGAKAQRELSELLRAVRADTGCCHAKQDRDTCAAERARKRAERAHLVIANQSLALARREFFRHLVFDECEHLHDQALAIWSHEVRPKQVRELLARLAPARSSNERGLLSRIAQAAPPESEAAEALEQAQAAARAALQSLERLEVELWDFKHWREEARRGREERDQHSLFREYCQTPTALGLLDAQKSLLRAGEQLAGALSELVALLDTLPLRGAARVRRNLETLRAEFDEQLAGLRQWLPLVEGRALFPTEVFHDLETDARGDDRLLATVLLPHEFLGRSYYPDLKGAVFVSATTWLRGGFESSELYLGLTRAASPMEDEERLPARVERFRVPEIFDYSRVLVAVPRDAPDPRESGKALFLEYVRRFAAHLAERTHGRLLVLFTNAEDCKAVAQGCEAFFARRSIPFAWQGMPGAGKEELAQRFRRAPGSVLFGLDTFWYGADFPGELLEYLVIVKLPYGVPDRYHHAQCAALGTGEQRKTIYLPRALGKFRQGFGRLMRRESDRGCVFVLDNRLLDPRHRQFLRELPLCDPFELDKPGAAELGRARLVRGDTDHCLSACFEHMGLADTLEVRGLARPFRETRLRGPDPTEATSEVHDEDPF